MSNHRSMEQLDTQAAKQINGGATPWQSPPTKPIIEPPVYLTQAIGEDGGDLPDLTLS